MKITRHMTSRRTFVAGAAAFAAGALLPLPAAARWGVVHELSGEATINGFRLVPASAIRPGSTIATGAEGRVWFTLGGDAYFLRPRSRLRLEPSGPGEEVVNALRLLSGAVGATFRGGAGRSLRTSSITIGVRGTGVYIETSPQETYACTCFGAAELRSVATEGTLEHLAPRGAPHLARRILHDPQTGTRIAAASLERHTNEEMARLERIAGRPNPFNS